MSVRSFHSVFMVTAVAGAVLGCYLVSLRVASERGALDRVERQIVQTEYDIRLLQTEIGTRGRLAQLERWNVRVLALSAPSADQILGDKFQLARLIAPQTKPALEAPVILATAPAPDPAQPLGDSAETKPLATGEILHHAGLKVAPSAPKQAQPRPEPARPEQAGPSVESRKASDSFARAPAAEAKPPVRTATSAATSAATPAATRPATSAATRRATPAATPAVDPLAPLPAGDSGSGGSRTGR
jgi:hypothetical protein